MWPICEKSGILEHCSDCKERVIDEATKLESHTEVSSLWMRRGSAEVDPGKDMLLKGTGMLLLAPHARDRLKVHRTAR